MEYTIGIHVYTEEKIEADSLDDAIDYISEKYPESDISDFELIEEAN